MKKIIIIFVATIALMSNMFAQDTIINIHKKTLPYVSFKMSEIDSITYSTGLAFITTNSASSITATTATCGGNVLGDGSFSVTAKGVCWSTSQNPTTANSITTNGTGTGSFTSSLTSLLPGTTYYVRAYATNTIGTKYGNQISFTTPAVLATLTTTTATSITATTASSGGNITNNGGANVTARGVCWGTTTNPTISGSHTTDGSGSGSFTSSLTGLTSGLTYYVRAYATNSAGTAYGNQISFMTTSSFVCGTSFTVTHVAGTTAPSTLSVTYGTVNGIVGDPTKCWITKNLGATTQANAGDDGSNNAAGWYWQFNKKQGFSHDGSTRTPSTTWITDITENSDWLLSNDPCNILLGTGWRLPTFTEWQNIDGPWWNYLDTYASPLKIHAAGYLAAAYDGDLMFRGVMGSAVYWSNNQSTLNNGNGNVLMAERNDAWNTWTQKSQGNSVRCLRE